MSIKFAGRDQSGQLHQGQLDVDSREQAITMLRRDGITPTKLEVVNEKAAGNGWFQRKITLDERILFTRQMYALSKSGLPIVNAVAGLADNHDNPTFQRILSDMSRQLKQGNALSNCMNEHEAVFSRLYISMIRMGESTGRLDEAFAQLIQHLEREKQTRQQIKQAVRYPLFVIAAITIAVAVVNLFVIPEIKSLFIGSEVQLPFATRLIIGFSDFSVQYWWLIAGIIVLIALIAWQALRTPAGQLTRDRWLIKLPIVGKIFYRIGLTRFCRPFAMMIDGGIPILQAINIAANTASNRYMGEAIDSMRGEIERGATMISASAATGLFNSLVLQMIAVGEQSGRLGDQLREVADFYDQEIEYQLKTLSQAIEPILISFLAFLVLILALGIFLPLWDLSIAIN